MLLFIKGAHMVYVQGRNLITHTHTHTHVGSASPLMVVLIVVSKTQTNTSYMYVRMQLKQHTKSGWEWKLYTCSLMFSEKEVTHLTSLHRFPHNVGKDNDQRWEHTQTMHPLQYHNTHNIKLQK